MHLLAQLEQRLDLSITPILFMSVSFLYYPSLPAAALRSCQALLQFYLRPFHFYIYHYLCPSRFYLIVPYLEQRFDLISYSNSIYVHFVSIGIDLYL